MKESKSENKGNIKGNIKSVDKILNVCFWRKIRKKNLVLLNTGNPCLSDHN